MTIYDRLIYAIEGGINLERLLIATGLDQHSFYQYMDNQLFTNEQLQDLRTEIKDWEG